MKKNNNSLLKIHETIHLISINSLDVGTWIRILYFCYYSNTTKV